MNNLYLIESDNYSLIINETKKIIKEHNLKEEDLNKYDLSITKIDNIIEDLDSYSFLQNKKIILGYDAVFLTKEKGEIEQNTDILAKYINSPNPDNILILACSKLDAKNEISPLIKKNFTKVDSNINIDDYITKDLKVKMDKTTIKFLTDIIGEDLKRIENELNKLTMYTDNITKEDIKKIVIPLPEDNLFNLMNAITKKDKEKSFKIYQDLINNNVEDISLIVILANQFRLIYQIKTLSNKTNKEIMDILDIKNEKQINALRYKIHDFSEKELINNIYKLSILDTLIKSNKILPNIALPLFIANL